MPFRLLVVIGLCLLGEVTIAAPLPSTQPASLPSTRSSTQPTNLLTFLGDLNTAPIDVAAGKRRVGERLPLWLTANGDRAVFVRDDTTAGREPWITDGTIAGTRLIADLEPGEASSEAREFVPIGGDKFTFVATTGDKGPRLYVTDGTAAGTIVLADAHPESAAETYKHFTRVGDQVYFLVEVDDASIEPFKSGAANDLELWITDGTHGGTRHVKRLPGAAPGEPGFSVAGRYYMRQARPRGVVWMSDGTPEGTTAVSLSMSGTPVATDRFLWFNNGRGQLFRVGPDLAAPVSVAADVSSDWDSMVSVGSKFFYTSVWRHQLFVMQDGEAGTTKMLNGTLPIGRINRLFAARGKVFFTALPPQPQPRKMPPAAGNAARDRSGNDPQPQAPQKQLHHGLFVSDGTPAGTRAIRMPVHAPDSAIRFEAATETGVIFAIEDNKESHLYYTDGSPTLPRRVFVVPNENGSSRFNGAKHFSNKLAFFVARTTNGHYVYATDGTAPGTVRITAPQAGGTDDAEPRFFALGNGRLAGNAMTADRGREIFVSDGTAAGTTMVDTVPGAPSGMANVSMPLMTEPDITVVGNLAFFVVKDPARGHVLWQSDGTVAGTKALFTLYQPEAEPKTRSPLGPTLWHRLIGGSRSLYLDVRSGGKSRIDRLDPQTGKVETIWTEPDGAKAPQRGPPIPREQPVDIDGRPTGSGPPSGMRVAHSPDANVLVWGDRLLVLRPTITGSAAVLISSETPGGPMEVLHEGMERGALFPRFADARLSAESPVAYFFTTGMSSGGLWQTDGTVEGTRLIRLPERTRITTEGEAIITVSGVYFRPDRPGESAMSRASEFYRYDPTSDAVTWFTARRENGADGLLLAAPGDFFADGDRLLFTATNRRGGRSLYATSGNLDETRLLKELTADDRSVDVSIARVGETILFTAVDGEVWTTDGTAAGTRVVPTLSSQFRGLRPTLRPLNDASAEIVAAHPRLGSEAWIVNDRFPPRKPTATTQPTSAPMTQASP